MYERDDHMSVKLKQEEDKLTALLIGEIDHHSSQEMRQEIDGCVGRTDYKLLILDFKDVTFMDSSGIGLVMGRWRAMQAVGGEVKLKNVPSNIQRVMRLAGIDRLAPEEK